MGNVLNRQFRAEKPNQKWVTDVTEFKIGWGKVFLFQPLVLCSGEIVAYQMEPRASLWMVGNPPEYPLVHSDKGWQYQIAHYQKRLREAGLEQSMSRKLLWQCSNRNLFGTLKAECLYLEEHWSISELRMATDRYIDYYNHERIKQKLKGLSSVEYRTQAQIDA